MKKIVIGLIVIMLAACAAPSSTLQNYSGFLSGFYTELQPAVSPSGYPVLRWISPKLQQGGYTQLVISPTQFYPIPQTSNQLYTNTLQQVLDYIDTSLYQRLSMVTKVVQTGMPNVNLKNTLRIQVAVTGVTAIEKGLQLFEDQTVINVEYKITDALTGEVVAAGMRKGFGQPLTHSADVITLDDLSPVLDQWAQDASSFFMKNSQM